MTKKIRKTRAAVNPQRITAKNFRKFGWVIEYPEKTSKNKSVNLFRIVLKEQKNVGWRIAYLVVRDKIIKKLEQHPFSFESFEPVKGKSILFVSKNPARQSTQSFYLTKSVILKKGIWHGVITLGTESEIKITENSAVKCVYFSLNSPLSRRG